MTTETTDRIADPEFPITWDDPADEQLTWFQDVMHNPLPITPLNATLFQPGFAEGASRAMRELFLPVNGIRTSVQNGYVYLGRIPVAGTPEELEARVAKMQQVTLELASTVLRDWRETFEPQVLERCERILSHDYAASSTADLAKLILSMKDELIRVWEIHMRVNIPPMGAVFALEEMLGQVLGEEVVPQARQLLQGFDNKSIETGRNIWELSRWIRSAPGFKDIVMASRVRGGAIEMDEHEQREEFHRRWQAFLKVYGWRSDRFFEIGHPSWREDPSTPLTQLKNYLALDDAQDPFASHARQAADRERLAGELEARLPEDVRPVFRMILPAAQQYVPIAEDHNFTIDQKFTTVVRFAVLELGRKLVAEERLRDAESVFFLKLDEIEQIAGGSDDELEARAQERRREHRRQAGLHAPVLIGTPPSPDEPPDPLVTKFFGVGLTPSEDTRVITGHPCSNGAVTGIVKVVRTLDEAGKVSAGDILVCRMTMPAWTPLFGVVGAVVADSGGPLSHCAIVAREYGIPCVAGTVNGTAVLRDGMRVRVDGSTGIVTVVDEKTRG